MGKQVKMESEITPISLPIIDFRGLEMNPEADQGSPEWDIIKNQVGKSLQEYGCFKGLTQRIPEDLGKEVFQEVKELFDLPLEVKMQNISGIPNGRGYVGKSPVTPLFESMGIDHPQSFDKLQCFSDVYWPRGKPSFSKTIHSFTKQISGMEITIRRMIVESLGVEKYMEEHMNSSISKLRVIKYGTSEANESKLGLAAHMDAGMMTILYQNQVDGLEIQTNSGEWISVKLSPNSFFVLIGESFHAWSNGRLHPPYHRVMVNEKEERYSVGMITVFKPGYIIKAPEELVDEKHPLLYRPFDFVEVLKHLQAEAQNTSGKPDLAPLLSYLGV